MRSVTLGKKYKDTITGFEGTATARCHYLSGCDHIQLAALVDGLVKEPWFDMPRLKPVRAQKAKRVLTRFDPGRDRGGPSLPPPGRSVPPDASASEG